MITRANLTTKTSGKGEKTSVLQKKNTHSSKYSNSAVDHILFLQRTIGNQAVQRLIESGVLRTKLTVGKPNDIYEQEADQVAEEVMRMPDRSKAQRKGVSEYYESPSIQGMCTDYEEEVNRQKNNLELDSSSQEELHRQPMDDEERILRTREVSGGAPEVNSAMEYQINSIRGGGQPLPAAANYFFSSRMGYDFSNVRVHDGKYAAESAKDINAKAYTIENNIVFNEGHYNTETLEGKKLLAHELAHVIQNSHNRIMPDELPAQNITKWQSLVTKGYEEEKNNNPDGMETNFIEALKLIGESKVNIARDGYNNPTKLKAGLNLDILYTTKAGSTGFLTDKGFTGRLPLDGTYPDSAIIIGRNAFLTNSPIHTIMVVEHEKTHLSHQRNSVSLLKEWEKKADMTEFQKEFKKQKAEFEKFAKSSSMKPSEIETGLAEIKARIIEKWFRSKKRKDKVELELLYESIGTMKAAHFDSEVLSGLAGFMKGFHLIEIKNGVPAQDLFFELTDYPASKGFWALNSGIVKEHYKKTLTDYYCNKLNETQRKAFDKHVIDYKNKKWSTDVTEYFKMLESITCKK